MKTKIITTITIDPVLRQICKNKHLKISRLLAETIRNNIPNFDEEYKLTSEQMMINNEAKIIQTSHD